LFAVSVMYYKMMTMQNNLFHSSPERMKQE
jgi:hypothetical protein